MINKNLKKFFFSSLVFDELVGDSRDETIEDNYVKAVISNKILAKTNVHISKHYLLFKSNFLKN